MTDTPDLDPRFLAPPDWQWGVFSRTGANGAERHMRFGYVFPQGGTPDAVVVCLPGLGDFCEKYFETVQTLLAKNLAVFVIDWVGQGLSTRYLSNPHKRHSAGFDEDIADAHTWISTQIIPRNIAHAPLVMLAHSMGGHIGLRYLLDHPDIFSCAVFSAPMWGIKATEILPEIMADTVIKGLRNLAPESYAPGNMDWQEMIRAFAGNDIFSSDAVRGAVHNAWCLHNPKLQVGGVTNAWLYEAFKSCQALHADIRVAKIKTPCAIAIAGKDALVSNKKTLALVQHMGMAYLLELPDSQHEILMERDDIRTQFFNAFFAMIKKFC